MQPCSFQPAEAFFKNLPKKIQKHGCISALRFFDWVNVPPPRGHDHASRRRFCSWKADRSRWIRHLDAFLKPKQRLVKGLHILVSSWVNDDFSHFVNLAPSQPQGFPNVSSDSVSFCHLAAWSGWHKLYKKRCQSIQQRQQRPEWSHCKPFWIFDNCDFVFMSSWLSGRRWGQSFLRQELLHTDMFGHHPMKFSETPEAGIKQCFIKAPFLWAVSLRMGVVLDTEHRQYRKCACFILSWGSNMTPAKEDPLLWQFDLRRSDYRCSPHLKTPIHNPGPTKGKQMPPTGKLQQSFFLNWGSFYR